MAVRKKTIKATKEEKEPVHKVTQVVEVVDDATGQTTPAVDQDMVEKEEIKEVVDELKDEVADVEEKVGELEEKVEPDVSTQEAKPEVPAQIAPKEKDKAVIEEIFGNNQTGVMPEITGGSSGSGKSLLIWALVVIGVALLTGLGLLVAVRGPESVTSMFASPTPTPTSTPVPTPTPVSPNRADITLEVLNGSGVGGAAAKMQEFLEGKGYDVGKAGNADKTDYAETEIHVKKDKEQYISVLEADLGEGYTVGTSAADLEDDAAFDAQIIVGKE